MKKDLITLSIIVVVVIAGNIYIENYQHWFYEQVEIPKNIEILKKQFPDWGNYSKKAREINAYLSDEH